MLGRDLLIFVGVLMFRGNVILKDIAGLEFFRAERANIAKTLNVNFCMTFNVLFCSGSFSASQTPPTPAMRGTDQSI